MFKKLLCVLFGHTIKQYTYGKYYGGVEDGIGRQHGFYRFECSRCGDTVRLYVHIPLYFKFDRDEYENGWRKRIRKKIEKNS